MLLRHALRSLPRQLLTTSCEQILLGSERDLFPSAGLLVVHPPSRRRRLLGIMFTVSTPGFLSFWYVRTSFCCCKKLGFGGLGLGLGVWGGEGALASALILYNYKYIKFTNQIENFFTTKKVLKLEN